jgi:hypothetical protein
MDSIDIKNNEDVLKDYKRGIWLTGFLILMFISNPLTAFLYISNPELLTTQYPSATSGILYFLGFMAILNFAFAIGIWKRKMWGLQGFYISVCIAFAVNMYIGLGILGSLMGTLGALLVFLTTRNKLAYFK